MLLRRHSQAAEAAAEVDASAAVDSDAFDPSAHTVDDVTAYLDQPDIDWEEIARVVAAEREGKARKGITEWLPPKEAAEETE